MKSTTEKPCPINQKGHSIPYSTWTSTVIGQTTVYKRVTCDDTLE